MNLKVDKAGRVVLPKPVRDRLELRAGAVLEMEETPKESCSRPCSRAPSLVRGKLGLWVYTGQVPPGFDPVRAVEKDREDRIRKLAGL